LPAGRAGRRTGVSDDRRLLIGPGLPPYPLVQICLLIKVAQCCLQIWIGLSRRQIPDVERKIVLRWRGRFGLDGSGRWRGDRPMCIAGGWSGTRMSAFD
jgi:hypothetical protein